MKKCNAPIFVKQNSSKNNDVYVKRKQKKVHEVFIIKNISITIYKFNGDKKVNPTMNFK